MTCLSLAYGLSRKIGKRLRDDGSLVGSALKKGRANGEFRGAKSFGALGLREYGDMLYSYTFDGQNNLIRIDLTESFSQNHTVFDVIVERSRLEIPRAIFCRDSGFFIMSTSEDFRRRNRILLHENGTYDMPDHLQFLNNASVKKSDDVNILSTLVAFNPNLKFDFAMTKKVIILDFKKHESISIYS